MSITQTPVTDRYWENETALVASSDRIRVNYFREAGKLQFNALRKTDNGLQPTQKNVTVDVRRDFVESPDIVELLTLVLEDVTAKADSTDS